MRKGVILVISALIVGLGLYYFLNPPKVPELSTPQAENTEKTMEERFKFELPDDSEKADLVDITDGDASGIASRKFENGKYSLVVLADLPDRTNGKPYQVVLEKGNAGEENYTPFLVGVMSFQKGGYLLEFESNTNYMDFPKVVVKGDSVILEGSF